MSQQLMNTINMLNTQVVEDVGQSFIDGIASVLATIECSDAERVILVSSLAAATQHPNMRYSGELARDIQGRELATYSVIEILLSIANDEDTDDLSRVMAWSLARELDAVLKIIEVLPDNPTHSCQMLLDGPL